MGAVKLSLKKGLFRGETLHNIKLSLRVEMLENDCLEVVNGILRHLERLTLMEMWSEMIVM